MLGSKRKIRSSSRSEAEYRLGIVSVSDSSRPWSDSKAQASKIVITKSLRCVGISLYDRAGESDSVSMNKSAAF
jgi:hypothetical protein